MSRSPWEMLPYFQTPSIFSLAATSTVQPFIPADPMRILLVFFPSSSTAVSVGVNPSKLVVGSNFTLFNSTGPTAMPEAWYPGLVQSAWYAVSSIGVTIWAYGVSMLKWPDDTVDRKVDPDAIAAAIKRLNNYGK